MSNSDSRAQEMKPLLMKAGIPAALSIAAYVVSRIFSKQSTSSIEFSLQHSDPNLEETETFHTLDSVSHHQDLHVSHASNIATKLVELESQLEDLQQREWELESRYLRYREVKEKEFILMEIKNKMLVEKLRAEFMLKEINLAEDGNKKVGSLLIEYIKLVYMVEELKKKNGLFERKVKKLSKSAKDQKLRIEARDEEMSEVQKEVQKKENVIQNLEDDMKQLKEAIDHLQRQKIELTNTTRKVEMAGGVSRDEIENEFACLRRSNALLRHELVRCHQQQDEEIKEDKTNQPHLVDLFESEDEDEDGNCTLNIANPQLPSKRRRFIQKLKKWVDGSIKEEKGKHENKCLGDKEAEDLFVHARKSCSSV